MAWTKYQFFLAGMMLITGAINTLSTAWADREEAPGCEKYCTGCGKKRKFDHPFLQSVGMFMGELSCLLFFKLVFCIWRSQRNAGKETSDGLDKLVDGNQDFSPFVFWPAAFCDMFGTSLMYIGLNMTDPSSFQMLRGAVIVFTALISVIFLQRNITKRMWLGILFVVLGLIVVGLAAFVGGDTKKKDDTNLVITGDLLIVLAQIVTAFQMVYEEKYVATRRVAPLQDPLDALQWHGISSHDQAVGWEGFFGFITLSVLLVPMYYIKVGVDNPIFNDPDGRIENALDAFCQIGSSYKIGIAQVGNVVSIAFFNFSGISVTRELSATTRMILDSIRTIIVWAVSLAVGWETFNAIQIPGFILLMFGTAVYNGLLDGVYFRIKAKCCGESPQLGENEPLIN